MFPCVNRKGNLHNLNDINYYDFALFLEAVSAAAFLASSKTVSSSGLDLILGLFKALAKSLRAITVEVFGLCFLAPCS